MITVLYKSTWLLKCQKWGPKHAVCPPNFEMGGGLVPHAPFSNARCLCCYVTLVFGDDCLMAHSVATE